MQPQQPYYGPPGHEQQRPPQPGQPYPPTQQPQGQYPQLPNPVSNYQQPVHPQAYDFIMNPAQPTKRPLLGGGGLQQRLLVVGGGLIVLMILFVIGSNLLKGGNNVAPALTSVLQSQQALVHLTDTTTLSSTYHAGTLPSSTSNFVATANLSLSSSKTQTLTYLQNNGGKIKPQDLNRKVSSTTDKQLTDSAASGTFNSTYREVVQTELKNYEASLRRANSVVTGPKGKALIESNFKQAELLLQQLQTQ